jgi:small nuclear ribonucleoprotein F
LNPRPFLTELLNRFIVVKLKWGLEYKGRLISFDKYMNLQLTDSEEIIEGKTTGSLGEILVR